jgi:hypothetical protein
MALLCHINISFKTDINVTTELDSYQYLNPYHSKASIFAIRKQDKLVYMLVCT